VADAHLLVLMTRLLSRRRAVIQMGRFMSAGLGKGKV
jgi:hypothetical protein